MACVESPLPLHLVPSWPSHVLGAGGTGSTLLLCTLFAQMSSCLLAFLTLLLAEVREESKALSTSKLISATYYDDKLQKVKYKVDLLFTLESPWDQNTNSQTECLVLCHEDDRTLALRGSRGGVTGCRVLLLGFQLRASLLLGAAGGTSHPRRGCCSCFPCFCGGNTVTAATGLGALAHRALFSSSFCDHTRWCWGLPHTSPLPWRAFASRCLDLSVTPALLQILFPSFQYF